MIENKELKYSVGALLYSPAINSKVGSFVRKESFGINYSLALCLEDSIADDAVEQAIDQLTNTLQEVYEARSEGFYLPKIFIRVRCASQLMVVFEHMKPYQDIVYGFILPKYTLSNADEYNASMLTINEQTTHKMYMMPILESKDIVEHKTRFEVLHQIKEKIDRMRAYVLNVRVGGNDFCNEFATRRHYDEMIYDILPIAQLLSDILTIFAREYVVSGPVWEFFSSEHEEWKDGLKREIRHDLLNGFIGKTVIHPNQIAVVNDMLKVSKTDYEDAKLILQWDHTNMEVGKSFAGERMNETKTHGNWAEKILILAHVYGVNR